MEKNAMKKLTLSILIVLTLLNASKAQEAKNDQPVSNQESGAPPTVGKDPFADGKKVGDEAAKSYGLFGDPRLSIFGPPENTGPSDNPPVEEEVTPPLTAEQLKRMRANGTLPMQYELLSDVNDDFFGSTDDTDDLFEPSSAEATSPTIPNPIRNPRSHFPAVIIYGYDDVDILTMSRDSAAITHLVHFANNAIDIWRYHPPMVGYTNAGEIELHRDEVPIDDKPVRESISRVPSYDILEDGAIRIEDFKRENPLGLKKIIIDRDRVTVYFDREPGSVTLQRYKSMVLDGFLNAWYAGDEEYEGLTIDVDGIQEMESGLIRVRGTLLFKAL